MSTNQAPCGWVHPNVPLIPTAASIGAATANHTHTPASIGAAATNHHHTPASIGAEPARPVVTLHEATSGTDRVIRSWSPELIRHAANAATNATLANVTAVRIGQNAGVAIPAGSIAIGRDAGRVGEVGPDNSYVRTSAGSIAIGQRAVSGWEAISIGQDSFSGQNGGGIAIGFGARARGAGDVVIGGGSENMGWSLGNILIGKQGRSTHNNVGLFGVRGHRNIQAVSKASSQIVMGSPGISTFGFSPWSYASDARDKKEITPLAYNAVDFIKGLQPKQFKYDLRQCYRRIEEITEAEYDALPEYEKQHRMITMPVYGLKSNGDDGKEGEIIPGFEWIEEYAYLGIPPKSEDPTCLENCKGDTPFDALTLGDIPQFATLNEAVETMKTTDTPRKPMLKTRFFRDYYEAMAAWKLSKCANSKNLTAEEAALPLVDAYWSCYPRNALVDEAGEIIKDAEGRHVFAQDEDGNPTLTWPFPRKASEFDPGRVQTRTAYFHIVEDEPDGTYAGKRYHNGFVAQEVEELANSMGFDFPGVQYFAHNKDENGVPMGDDAYAFAMEEMTAPIVAALQQALTQLELQDQRIKRLEQLLEKNQA